MKLRHSRAISSLVMIAWLWGCGSSGGDERASSSGGSVGTTTGGAGNTGGFAAEGGSSPTAGSGNATGAPECAGPAECSNLAVSCIGTQTATAQGSEEECAAPAFAAFESELHGAEAGVRVADPEITTERSYCGKSSLTTTVCAVNVSPPVPYHVEIPVPDDAIGKSLKLYYYIDGETGPWNVLLFGLYVDEATEEVGWSIIAPGDVAANGWRELAVDSIPAHKNDPDKFTKLDRIAFAGVHTDASQPDPWAARIFIDHISIE